MPCGETEYELPNGDRESASHQQQISLPRGGAKTQELRNKSAPHNLRGLEPVSTHPRTGYSLLIEEIVSHTEAPVTYL